ncbi:polyketide cyclase [Deltaproteobacteria bacterium PRO3]|nr:polyketide cyclase [Deltaproteobacteria bacterium PRO3]
MLSKILIVLAVVAVLFVVVVALRPADFKVSRSLAVSAPPAAAFAQVDDFRLWETWNPWGKLDPAMKQSYSGSQSGAGAAYAWAGNSQVGEGRMTILESRPNERILIQLEFLKPFAATHTAEFTFKPEGDKTLVTWSMFGKNNFMAKAMGLFMNMDKMIGGQFEKGLADLKAVAEAPPRPQ